VNAGGTIPWALVDKQAAGKPGAEAAVCDRGRWRLAEGGAAMWAHVASAATRQQHAFKRWVRLTGGPSPISDFLKIFKQPNLKSKMVTFPLSNIHKNLNIDILKHKEQLSFLSQLQIPSGFQVKTPGTN
jgi:hypothetical protein